MTVSRKQIACQCFLLFLAATQAHAASFREACPDIPACAKAVGELLGQNDRKPTAEMKKKWAEEERRYQEELAQRRRESRQEVEKKAKQ